MSRDEAEKDGAEVLRAVATADGRVAKGKVAREVLELLRKGVTCEKEDGVWREAGANALK